MEEKRRVIVIGGGFAGLTAAAELSSSHDVTLLEASGCLGMSFSFRIFIQVTLKYRINGGGENNRGGGWKCFDIAMIGGLE